MPPFQQPDQPSLSEQAPLPCVQQQCHVARSCLLPPPALWPTICSKVVHLLDRSRTTARSGTLATVIINKQGHQPCQQGWALSRRVARNVFKTRSMQLPKLCPSDSVRAWIWRSLVSLGQLTSEDIPIADNTSELNERVMPTLVPSKVQNEKACGNSGALEDLDSTMNREAYQYKRGEDELLRRSR